MDTTSTISKNVMRRVRVIHMMRPILSMTALASLACLALAWGIGREVWVAHVVQNFVQSAAAGHLIGFLIAAFVNTRFVVQALVVAASVTALYTIVGLAKTARSSLRFA